jgi:hypothetical protein
MNTNRHDGRRSSDLGANPELATVESYFSPNDAYMARLKLESAGIQVFLDNENLVAVNPLYGPATGGIKLRVPAEQAKEALQIISNTSLPTCPSCTSQNVSQKPVSKVLFLVALLCLTLPLWLIRRSWICQDCGHHWK